MDCVVSPVDHILSVAEEEVNTTLSPIQISVGPLAVITGIAGVGFTVTASAAETDEHPDWLTVTS